MDFFTEYIIKAKKTPKSFLLILAMVLAALLALYISLYFLSHPLFSSLVLFADAGVIYLSYIVITSFNIEFEYTVTNNDFDIDKIINKTKRKRLASFKISDIEIMAPVNDERFKEQQSKNFQKTIMAGITPTDKDAYFVIFDLKGERCKLVFNPNEKILEYSKRANPRNVYLKES